MKNLHSRFPANTNAASYSNLQRYSYHVAGGVGEHCPQVAQDAVWIFHSHALTVIES